MNVLCEVEKGETCINMEENNKKKIEGQRTWHH